MAATWLVSSKYPRACRSRASAPSLVHRKSHHCKYINLRNSMMFLRKFATTRSRLASFAQTLHGAYSGVVPTFPKGFAPKAAIFLATPQNLSKTIETAIMLFQSMQMQVVVAGVDRMAPNLVSTGVSQLWFDESLQISKPTLLSAISETPEPRESDGIHPVGAKVPWKHVEGSLLLGLGSHTVRMALANTAFATNTFTTLFYFQKDAKTPHMGQTLASLHLQVPAMELAPPQVLDRWTQLTSETLTVTKCKGNLVLSINNMPASQFLENNEKLMSLASKDTKVYVKVFRDETCRRYEVIAGGGGWGTKADLLAVSPEAVLARGDRLEFYMVTPDDRFKLLEESALSSQVRFECAPESTTFETANPDPVVIDNFFGAASEQGFQVDGVNHKSAGEAVSFQMDSQ